VRGCTIKSNQKNIFSKTPKSKTQNQKKKVKVKVGQVQNISKKKDLGSSK